MINQTTSASYFDINSLKTKQDSLETVAKQFEGVFLQMVLKSMNDANQSFKSDMFSSDQSEFYEDMYASQMALTLSQSDSVGLAKVLVKQLQQQGE